MIVLNEEMDKLEEKYKIKLQKKVPVFLTVSGRASKTFTNGFTKPYDDIFTKAMQLTTEYMCSEVLGCIFAYTAYDEITLVITDYHKPNSSPWFDYDMVKMCSAAASIATDNFGRFFIDEVDKFIENYDGDDKEEKVAAYENAIDIGATFTAKAFNVPENRVVDMIYWKQLDYRRHAIQAYGRQKFGTLALRGKCNNEVIDMLREEGIEWSELPTHLRHGSCCSKGTYPFVQKKVWMTDTEMPMFNDENKTYLQDILDTVRIKED